jgi:hypothetical protein
MTTRNGVVAAGCLALAACVGTIGDGTPEGDNPNGDAQWASPAMRRLTVTYYV